MKSTIEIIVSPQGELVIDAIGFQGADCQKATQALEEALGVVRSRVKKPEFYTRCSSRNQQRLGS